MDGRVVELSDQEASVGKHYDEVIFDYEVERLANECPVEYEITTRYLKRFVPAGSVVAEVGVGGGAYSVFLARQGCRLYLADVSQQLLETTRQRLDAEGFAAQILGAQKSSATGLHHIPNGACAVVLLLGPLYHLCVAAERERAVQEAARVLADNGVVLAAGINRLAYLRDAFRHSPREGITRQAFHGGFLQDGNLDPQHAPPLGFAHLSTTTELRALMSAAFEEIALIGVESFTNLFQGVLRDIAAEDRRAWLQLVEQTGATTEGLAVSDHFLYIGRKLTRR